MHQTPCSPFGMGQPLGHIPGGFLQPWNDVYSLCPFGLHPLQQDSGDYGIWTRVVLHLTSGDISVLRNVVCNSRETVNHHLHCQTRWTGCVSLLDIRGNVNEDQPDIQDIQQRGQGHGEAA